jgi:hypothetical protein
VPASGIVSRYSTISPFSVRGPDVGSVQPILRFSVRTLAAALTMNVPRKEFEGLKVEGVARLDQALAASF